jgi:hypothetical protein
MRILIIFEIGTELEAQRSARSISLDIPRPKKIQREAQSQAL